MTFPPVQICPTGPDGPVHILIDSTGLKVHRGRRPRDKRNRRQWRKLHLVVDADTSDILASALTTRRWRNSSGYMRRSLVETAISRFKMIIGRRLRSRTMASQRTESKIACRILNTMTELGMPDSYCAA